MICPVLRATRIVWVICVASSLWAIWAKGCCAKIGIGGQRLDSPAERPHPDPLGQSRRYYGGGSLQSVLFNEGVPACDHLPAAPNHPNAVEVRYRVGH